MVLDAIISGVLKNPSKDFQGLVLPTLSLGKSLEHLAFAGTVSLKTSSLIAVADDVVASLSVHQFNRFVFLNGHGGNTALLQAIAFDLDYKYDVKIYNIDLWNSSFFNEITEQCFPELVNKEIHAGSIESSLLLYLRPELVGDIPRISPPASFGKPTHSSWKSQDIHPSGVIGDPTQASAETGKHIYDCAVENVSRLLNEIYRTR